MWSRYSAGRMNSRHRAFPSRRLTALGPFEEMRQNLFLTAQLVGEPHKEIADLCATDQHRIDCPHVETQSGEFRARHRTN
jgi:hypothetical protein